MVADVLAVEIDAAVLLDAIELGEELFLLKAVGGYKSLPVPAPAVPPVRVVALGGGVDERVHLARRLVGAPRVRHRDGEPGAVVITGRGEGCIQDARGNVGERPVPVDLFLNARRADNRLARLHLSESGGRPKEDQHEENRAVAHKCLLRKTSRLRDLGRV